ncbi:histone acetyltransferase KAT7-like isoform X2 [Periplaneta americana]|uniref:histone acetyltransferase KAT7-like isoform X2 n=1 Tax=Periplaneta americana TaxID=6978 RepID=UPI0037E80C91
MEEENDGGSRVKDGDILNLKDGEDEQEKKAKYNSDENVKSLVLDYVTRRVTRSMTKTGDVNALQKRIEKEQRFNLKYTALDDEHGEGASSHNGDGVKQPIKFRRLMEEENVHKRVKDDNMRNLKGKEDEKGKNAICDLIEKFRSLVLDDAPRRVTRSMTRNGNVDTLQTRIGEKRTFNLKSTALDDEHGGEAPSHNDDGGRRPIKFRRLMEEENLVHRRGKNSNMWNFEGSEDEQGKNAKCDRNVNVRSLVLDFATRRVTRSMTRNGYVDTLLTGIGNKRRFNLKSTALDDEHVGGAPSHSDGVRQPIKFRRLMDEENLVQSRVKDDNMQNLEGSEDEQEKEVKYDLNENVRSSVLDSGTRRVTRSMTRTGNFDTSQTKSTALVDENEGTPPCHNDGVRQPIKFRRLMEDENLVHSRMKDDNMLDLEGSEDEQEKKIKYDRNENVRSLMFDCATRRVTRSMTRTGNVDTLQTRIGRKRRFSLNSTALDDEQIGGASSDSDDGVRRPIKFRRLTEDENLVHRRGKDDSMRTLEGSEDEQEKQIKIESNENFRSLPLDYACRGVTRSMTRTANVVDTLQTRIGRKRRYSLNSTALDDEQIGGASSDSDDGVRRPIKFRRLMEDENLVHRRGKDDNMRNLEGSEDEQEKKIEIESNENFRSLPLDCATRRVTRSMTRTGNVDTLQTITGNKLKFDLKSTALDDEHEGGASSDSDDGVRRPIKFRRLMEEENLVQRRVKDDNMQNLEGSEDEEEKKVNYELNENVRSSVLDSATRRVTRSMTRTGNVDTSETIGEKRIFNFESTALDDEHGEGAHSHNCEVFRRPNGLERSLAFDCVTRRVTRSMTKSGYDDTSEKNSACNPESIDKNIIEKIRFGRYKMESWYPSPYPGQQPGKQPLIYVCEFCLEYMMCEDSYRFHLVNCKCRHPPGKVIYRNGTITVWEVDGSLDTVYCQNLCLMAKLFIENKVVFFEVNPFLFYIMCVKDDEGLHLIGYFSKVKDHKAKYNLNCFMILPPFQNKGYGKFLISLSYELSKLEGRVGTPEKPLSTFGRSTYLSYWTWAILSSLTDVQGQISLEKLSNILCMAKNDIMTTLNHLKLSHCLNGRNFLLLTSTLISDLVKSDKYKQPRLLVDRRALSWQAPSKKPQEKSK